METYKIALTVKQRDILKSEMDGFEEYCLAVCDPEEIIHIPIVSRHSVYIPNEACDRTIHHLVMYLRYTCVERKIREGIGIKSIKTVLDLCAKLSRRTTIYNLHTRHDLRKVELNEKLL